MAYSQEIMYVMAAMENSGVSSKKLFNPSAAPSHKPGAYQDETAKAETEVRYSTDAESLMKGERFFIQPCYLDEEFRLIRCLLQPGLPAQTKDTRRSSLLKRITRRS